MLQDYASKQRIQIFDRLIQKKVHFIFIAIEKNIRLDGEQNRRTKIVTAIFSLLAEIEKDFDYKTMLAKNGTQSKSFDRHK